MNDLINMSKEEIDISSLTTNLNDPYRKQYFTFLKILQERDILFTEDLTAIESAFNMLVQADKTLAMVDRLEGFLNALMAKDALIDNKADLQDMVKLNDALSKNRSLYARLINQYNNMMKEYFSTPAAKLKVLSDFNQHKKEKDNENPILSVLE